jgi:hypothetical protein
VTTFRTLSPQHNFCSEQRPPDPNIANCLSQIGMEHFENFTIRKPGSWFHGWTIPNFPWTFSENPNKDLAVTFETFRTILSYLNEGARVNGDIEKHKAEELYYHFLLHYFPDSKQIPVLRRRHSNPNTLDAEAYLLINDEGSLIWPPLPSSPHRRTASDQSSQTVVRNSETSQGFGGSSTNHTSASDMQGSNSDIPSLIASLLAAPNPEGDVGKQIMDDKDILKAQSKEIYDFSTSRDDDDSIPARIKPVFEKFDRSKLKRKSSSDDTSVWLDYYEKYPLRNPKRFKSNSDDNAAMEEPVNQEMVDLFSGMRNRTDRTLEVPTHDEIEYSLVSCTSSPFSIHSLCAGHSTKFCKPGREDQSVFEGQQLAAPWAATDSLIGGRKFENAARQCKFLNQSFPRPSKTTRRTNSRLAEARGSCQQRTKHIARGRSRVVRTIGQHLKTTARS